MITQANARMEEKSNSIPRIQNHCGCVCWESMKWVKKYMANVWVEYIAFLVATNLYYFLWTLAHRTGNLVIVWWEMLLLLLCILSPSLAHSRSPCIHFETESDGAFFESVQLKFTSKIVKYWLWFYCPVSEYRQTQAHTQPLTKEVG